MNILLAINFILYLGLFYYNWKKKTSGWILATPIIGLFLTSAFCAFFYYDSDLYQTLSESKNKTQLSFISILYLFLCFCIFIYPFRHYKKCDHIRYPKLGKTDLLFIGFVFIGIISLIPFFESLASVSAMSMVDMADNYHDNISESIDVRNHFSPIGRICNGIVTWFQYIIPMGFFYLIQKKKKWYWCLLVLMGALCPMLTAMIRGGRGPLFQTLCIFLFNFLIFYRTFSLKTRKVITHIVIIGVSAIATLLIFITFSRYNNEVNYVIEQIFRYLGEGYINFAETGWYVTEHTEGHNMFNGTGYTFFKNIFPIFEARDYEHLSQILHIRMYVYYTVMGDAFLDFGIIGGILFFLLLSFLIQRNTLKAGNFSSLLLLNLYAKIGFNGIFCWAYMYRLDFVVFTLLIYLIIRYFER